MSKTKSLVNQYEVPLTPPPTYNEATSGEEVKEEAPYPRQEGCPIGGKHPFPPGPPPSLLTMPVPLRDVGVGGNVVYIVNQPGSRNETVEGNSVFGASFGNKAIRAVFVRKVYATLMLQLLTTLTFIAWFMFHEGTRRFLLKYSYTIVIAYITFLVTYIVLVCCGNLRRSWPCNIILLSIFTLAMSFWAATISAFYDTTVVLMTIGICTIVCLAVSLFSIQTKWDITGKGIYLFVFLVVVFLFGMVALVVLMTTGSRIMSVVYSGLLALVFALYLVYDTQQIIGGRKVELSAEEHIFGALQLYIDIVNLYLVLLSLNSNSCK